MLVQHGRLAAEVGVAPENIFIIENGQPIEFLPDGSARRGAPVEAGYVFVDGLSVGEVGDVVLRDRRALANDGMFLIVVTVDKQTGSLVGRPEIVTRGFVGGAGRAGSSRAPPSGSWRALDDARATTSARSACSRRRSRTASRSTCTSRRSAGRWSSRWWSRSDGRPASGRSTPRRTTRVAAAPRRPARARGRASDLRRGTRPLDPRHRPPGGGRGHAHRAVPARRGHPQPLRQRRAAAVLRAGCLAAGRPAHRGGRARRARAAVGHRLGDQRGVGGILVFLGGEGLIRPRLGARATSPPQLRAGRRLASARRSRSSARDARQPDRARSSCSWA